MSRLVKKHRKKRKNVEKQKRLRFNEVGFWSPHGISCLRVNINKHVHPDFKIFMQREYERKALNWNCNIKSSMRNLIDGQAIGEQLRITHCEKHGCGHRIDECSVRLHFRGNYYGIDGNLSVSECVQQTCIEDMHILNDEFTKAAKADLKAH